MNKVITIMIMVLVLSSCGPKLRRVEINCELPGGIILEKSDHSSYNGPVYYTIKRAGEITKVEAFEIDFGYNVGDTISKPCLRP